MAQPLGQSAVGYCQQPRLHLDRQLATPAGTERATSPQCSVKDFLRSVLPAKYILL